MLQKETLQFLRDLKENNNKEWFDKNRKKYEEAKKDFLGLVEVIGLELQNIDPKFDFIPTNTKIFRINKDVRFSKDKSPYKTNFGAFLSKGGMKSGSAGYYIHIEADNNSGIAGGMYQPLPPQLQKIREHISENYDELEAILEDKSFAKYFPTGPGGEDKLKNVPRGFNKDDQAAELLKNKSFTVWIPFKDSDILKENFIDQSLEIFREIYKLNKFLNEIL
jgi:uncharacterized protein (TIGR02453 family)